MIQASTNPRIQKIKKLLKSRKQNSFLIEGKKLFREAIDADLEFEAVFVTSEAWSKEQHWLKPLERQGMSIHLITPAVLKSISDVQTPQGILGIALRPRRMVETTTVKGVALFLLSIRDPGNFGAIARTAEASGCDWIGYSQDCADPFQPKVVRASMGSIFRVPVVEIPDTNAFLNMHKSANVRTVGLATDGKRSLLEWKPSLPVVICIGSESHGLPMDLPLTEKIHIPMRGKVESLNAAVAAAICLYYVRFSIRNDA